MDNANLQRLLYAAGFDPGPIDGQVGPQTKDTMKRAAGAFKMPVAFSGDRYLVAHAQACLNHLGFEAGAVDGWEGHNTREAVNSFLHREKTNKKWIVDRPPWSLQPHAPDIPRQHDVGTYYGQPGPDIRRQLTAITLPFHLRIDYNLLQMTNRITVHEKAAPSLKTALIEVHDFYGYDRMRALGIDRYAGAYNHRKMRGGSKWSMHAYGCAIDFYAQPNGLRTKCPEALFCGADYKPFLDIMESYDWLPAIRLWGRDAMHFQRARL